MTVLSHEGLRYYSEMEGLGIDVGGSSVKVSAVRDDAAIWTGQSRFYARADRATLVQAIRDAIRDRPINTSAVGICVPGLLDGTGRKVLLAVNIPGLNGTSLDELVAEAAGIRPGTLHITNDATAAGSDLVHSRRLAGRVLVLSLGTGVGMSIFDAGRILRVEGDSPGHIGQADVSLSPDAPIGPDGGAGSLEAYLGAPALIAKYGSMDNFFAAVRCTDPPFLALSRAIRICHAIYRPNHIILAGGIGVRLKHLISILKSQIAQNLTTLARPDWTLSSADHDFHASTGAARLAIN